MVNEPANKKIKKPEWNIEKEIKQELNETLTPNIEEFETQDIDFDDDFSNDAKTSQVKNEPVSTGTSTENPTTDITDEFFNDEFEIFPLPKKETTKELKPLTSTWPEQGGDNQTVSSVQSDGQLPLQTNETGEKVLRFYWLDAWEDRFVKPGVIYLFGKVYVDPSNKKAGCVSCCLVVKNVNRQIFLLPREYVSFLLL